MTDALKPCPFCGSEADEQLDVGLVGVRCPSCAAVGPADIRGDRTELWNRRAPAARVSAPAETLSQAEQWNRAGREPYAFHPQASHVTPDYRDGWNAALAAVAAQGEPAQEGDLWRLIREYAAARIDCDRSNGTRNQGDLRIAERALSNTLGSLRPSPKPEAAGDVRASNFEAWYASYVAAHRGDKQRARDAYAAGMADVPTPPAPTEQADIERRIKVALKDPVQVHAAMLRGEIAKPSRAQMEHVWLGAPDAAEQADREDAAKYRAINTPEVADFISAVHNEALHQRERWGAEGGAGKRPEDWVALCIYLLGKAVKAHYDNDMHKHLHHTISTAAVCLNWHAGLTGAHTAMRPGIDHAARASQAQQPGPAEPAKG